MIDEMKSEQVMQRFKELWDAEVARRGNKVNQIACFCFKKRQPAIGPSTEITSDVSGCHSIYPSSKLRFLSLSQASLLRTFIKAYLRDLVWTEVAVTLFIAFSLIGPSYIVYQLLLYSFQQNTDWLKGLWCFCGAEW